MAEELGQIIGERQQAFQEQLAVVGFRLTPQLVQEDVAPETATVTPGATAFYEMLIRGMQVAIAAQRRSRRPGDPRPEYRQDIFTVAPMKLDDDDWRRKVQAYQKTMQSV